MGKNCVHWAVIRQSREMLAFLVESNADLNLTDYSGKTPLTYAILQEDEFIIKVPFSNIASARLQGLSLEG